MGKKLNSLFLTTLLLICFSIPVFSLGEYYQMGGSDSDFEQGFGYFNSENPDFIATPSQALTSPSKSPLVADLDGDGVNEIIVKDGASLKLFESHTLNFVDSVSISSDEGTSNIIVYDYDGDGEKEILLVLEISQALLIFSYNGSLFTQEQNFTTSGLAGIGDGEAIIGCRDVDHCLLAYVKNDNGINGVADHLIAVGFGSSGFQGTGETIFSGVATPQEVICLPKLRIMTVANYDGDSEDEFIFSALTARASGSENYKIFAIFTNSSNHVTLEKLIQKDMGDISGTASNCRTHDVYGRFITSPLIFDANGGSSDGLEFIIGAHTEIDAFKMDAWHSNGVFLDNYPRFFQGSGTIISNIMRINIDPDTGTEEFCVLGHNNLSEEIDLVCASIQGTGFFGVETDEFQYDISSFTEVGISYDIHNIMAHASQQSAEEPYGTNLHEIVTSYGVFEIDYSFNNHLNLLYENPKHDGVVIPVDVEQLGRDDLLVLTNTNLWYIDDGFSKSSAEFDEVTINPCINSTWKINTSVSVTVTPLDVDGDLVSARAVLYEGHENEQSHNWTANSTTNTTFPFSFIANQTIGVGTLKVYVRDNDEGDIISKEISFSVSSYGVELDDCITTLDYDTSLDIEAEAEAEQNDTVTQFVEDTKRELNLNVSNSTLFLFLMVLIGGAIWWGGTQEKYEPKQTFAMVGIIEIILIFIGVSYEFISVSVIIILLVILSLFLLGVYRRNIFGGG